jgi:hypothetical protein
VTIPGPSAPLSLIEEHMARIVPALPAFEVFELAARCSDEEIEAMLADRRRFTDGEAYRKRRSSPMSVETEERVAILCDKALQAFGAKLCQRLVQRAGTRSGCWGQRRGSEGPRHQIVDARLRMAVGDRLEGRFHPGIGIDAIELAGRDERSET